MTVCAITAKLSGSCLCGAVRFEIDGPVRVHYCHCTMCRKATGAAAAVLCWVDSDRLTWRGPAAPAERRSSPIAVRRFCRACGTPVALIYDAGTEIGIHVGTLDQCADLAPQYHYGIESRLPWFDAGADLPGKATEENLEVGK